ncbi:MAG: hypothetical protein MUO72_09680 [Bacteroidales bacterium]|nr:hypothetical protein [Bacteroidales bacterium]
MHAITQKYFPTPPLVIEPISVPTDDPEKIGKVYEENGHRYKYTKDTEVI